MSRKSQVEKFNAKWNKKKQDENVVTEQKARAEKEQKSVMSQAKSLGVERGEIRIHTSPEKKAGDVVFAADFEAVTSGTFQKIMSGLSREGVRDSLKEIEDVSYNANLRFFNSQLEMLYKVQEQASYDGTIRALHDYNVAQEKGQLRAFNEMFNMMTKQEEPDVKDEPKIDVKVEKHEEPVKEEVVEQYVAYEAKREFNTDDAIRKCIIKANELGVDVYNGKAMRDFGGSFSTAYQRFLKMNKGIKGAWKEHVTNVLNEN